MFFGITIQKLKFVTVVMFFAGFVDSIAGSGGVLSLPAYMLTGLSPTAAFVCNKTSACIGTSVSTINYLRKGKLNIKVTLISALCGIVGSNIAARILLAMDPAHRNQVK